MTPIRDELHAYSAVSPGFQDQRRTQDVRLLYRSQQMPSRHVQINQPADNKQSVGILVQTTVADLGEAKDLLQH